MAEENNTPLKSNKKASDADRKDMADIFELCKIFRLKNVIVEKHGNLHMLKNDHGNGGLSFTQAKRINGTLMNFKSASGSLLKSRIDAKNVKQLYDALLPIREMIENRGWVDLSPSPMFKILTEPEQLKKSHDKNYPKQEPLKPQKAWAMCQESRSNRIMSWEDVQRLDKLSTKLYLAFTTSSKEEISGQRLDKPEEKLPESRFGTEHPGDDALELKQ